MYRYLITGFELLIRHPEVLIISFSFSLFFSLLRHLEVFPLIFFLLFFINSGWFGAKFELMNSNDHLAFFSIIKTIWKYTKKLFLWMVLLYVIVAFVSIISFIYFSSLISDEIIKSGLIAKTTDKAEINELVGEYLTDNTIAFFSIRPIKLATLFSIYAFSIISALTLATFSLNQSLGILKSLKESVSLFLQSGRGLAILFVGILFINSLLMEGLSVLKQSDTNNIALQLYLVTVGTIGTLVNLWISATILVFLKEKL